MEYAKQINADVAVVSTDYSKAYDLVQHDPLFAIAKRIGGDGYSQWQERTAGHTATLFDRASAACRTTWP